jgi:hypothetical protein
MTGQGPWVREVLNYVCPLATKHWFKHPRDTKVFVSGYRVYQVPSLRGVFSRRPLVADFEQVRAVFGNWDAPYQVLGQNVIEKPDGQITGEYFGHVQRTGGGILLLLMTPLPDNYNASDENAAKERVSFIRSLMVSLMGRNAAYEHEFDMSVECGPREVSALAPVFTTPPDERPAVNRNGIELVTAALEKLSALDDAAQNRIRLALRWYQRSFGDDRLVRDTKEGRTDDFINCWLALETLAMEGTTNIAPIKRMLREIHGLDAQQTGDLFPIGRVYGLRNAILHEGHIRDLKDGLTKFMTDVFADLLLQTLDLPSGANTAKYLNGSANELI